MGELKPLIPTVDVTDFIKSIPDVTYSKINSIRFDAATGGVEVVYE